MKILRTDLRSVDCASRNGAQQRAATKASRVRIQSLRVSPFKHTRRTDYAEERLPRRDCDCYSVRSLALAAAVVCPLHVTGFINALVLQGRNVVSEIAGTGANG